MLVHGGAGDIPDSRVQLKFVGCKAAAKEGYKVLKNGGSVVDAVEAAVKVMEDDQAFNAGKYWFFIVRKVSAVTNLSKDFIDYFTMHLESLVVSLEKIDILFPFSIALLSIFEKLE